MGRLVTPMTHEEYNRLTGFRKWWQDNGVYVIAGILVLGNVAIWLVVK